MRAFTVLDRRLIEVPNECVPAGIGRTEIEVHDDEVILVCTCCNATGQHPNGVDTYYCQACSEEADLPRCPLPRLEDVEPPLTTWPRQN